MLLIFPYLWIFPLLIKVMGHFKVEVFKSIAGLDMGAFAKFIS